MATTIKLKNGSGAPLAGDLVQGEPALDLTNKRLYTEDSGGTVIEVGTNPTSLTTGTFTSTGIDDNATSTAITIDASENVNIGAVGTTTLTTLTGPFNGDVVKMDGSSGVSDRHLIFSNSSNSQQWDIDAEGGASSLGVLSFSTNSTERLRIDSSGNVGIGTASPSKRLHIDTATNGGILLEDSTNSITGIFYSSGSNSLALGSTSNHPVKFFTNNSERMRITSNGNVLIGRTDETLGGGNGDDLQIGSGSGGAGLTIHSSTTGTGDIQFSDGVTAPNSYKGLLRYDHNLDAMTFWSNNSEKMRIDSSGNVGIGTTSPAAQLNLSSPNNIGGASGTFTNAALKIGTTATGMFFDTNEIHGGETLNFFSNGTDNSVADYIRFSTGGSAGGERMRIDSAGNVGIGGSPVSSIRRLMVKDTGDVRVDIRSGSDTNLGAIDFSDTSNTARGQLIYDHNDDSMQFKTLSTERMRIDSSGNVGIGTSTINRKLEIAGNNNAGAKANYLRITDTDTSATLNNQQGGIEFYTSDTGNEAVTASIETIYAGSGAGVSLTFSTAPSGVTGASERLRIDNNGNVGIGTASPSYDLQISKNGGGAATRLDIVNTGTATNDDTLLSFLSGSNNNENIIYFGDTDDSNVGVLRYNHNGDYMSFTTSAAEAMRIDSSGNLSVGTTTSGSSRFVASKSVATAVYAAKIIDTNTTAANCYGLNIDYSAAAPNGSANQFIYCEDSSTVRMQVNSNGGIYNFQAYDANLSDERAKKDIVEAGNYLEKLCNISVKNFRYKEDAENSKHHLGVIAQEVEAVAPEFVNKAAWDHKGEKLDTVYNNDVMFAMLKAMQELSAQVNELKAEVAALKGA